MKHRLEQILRERRILVNCGTGGVGKTSLSCAIAIRAALQGKKAAVITIDPAKRLSTALGMTVQTDRPTDLTQNLIEAILRMPPHDRPDPSGVGKIVALMPDTAANFKELVKDLAPSPALIERIKVNPIFQIFTKEFSGTNEYLAVERLQALDALREYDLIVLDTPPSRNALAFLNAPKVLAEFFDERIIRWLVLPTHSLVNVGIKKALGILEKLTGAGFMTHLFDFASTLFDVRMKFMANLEKTLLLLESQSVGFLMTTIPSPDTASEVGYFINSLKGHRFNFDGVILNRTLDHLQADAQTEADPSAALKLVAALQARQLHALTQLKSANIPLTARIPELARDVHSLEDLIHVAMAFDRQS